MKPIYKDKYPHLFEPLKVGTKKIPFRNRVLMGPMGLTMYYGIDNGHFNQFGIEGWTEVIRGGVASITINTALDSLKGDEQWLNINTDVNNHAKMHLLQRSVHAYQGKTFIELYHMGRCAAAQFNQDVPVYGSTDGEYQGHHVKGMDAQDMENVLQDVRKFARLTRQAGFDGIQCHFAHGWLFHDFLSPLSNQRTDEYGGSVENRCRFPRMVLKAIREEVGEDLIIEIRLNGSDETEGGITPEDAAQQALILQEYADMIHITCGHRLDMTTRAQMQPTYLVENEHNVHASNIIRNTPGIRIPIGVVGAINDPVRAEAILAEGKADYIVMVRALMADPQWVNKVREGREEDIRPCLRCDYCLDHGRRKALFKGKELAVVTDATNDGACAVNPFMHQGISKKLFPKPDRSKVVAVVGGGVAGLNAALAAADRGHVVTLYERTGRLGGQIILTDEVRFKKELKAYHEYLECQVRKHPNITLKLNTKATPELISDENPDAAIIAVGAKQRRPEIPGAEKASLAFAAFHNPDRFGKEIVIVGGGHVGCELSLYLAENGHKCTVIEQNEFIAPTAELSLRVSLLQEMEKYYVKTYAGTEAIEVVDTGVKVKNKEQGEFLIKADSVIFAIGTEPLVKERDSFKDVAFDVINVGDALDDGIADVPHAVETGFNAGYIL